MYCPNCNQEYDGRFCPECRTKLIEKPVASDGPSINLGDANAICGGLNVNVHREDNSQTTYHVEATKSGEQLLQENEERFLEAVQQRLSDGPLAPERKQAELELMALQCHISPARARDIITQVRKRATAIQDELGNEFLAQQTLQEIINAVSHNQTAVLLRRLPALKQLAEKSAAANVQYYYHMLQASLTPEACTIDFLNAHTDNYWQLFWVHIAHIKMGHTDNATALLARLGGFGAPRGDIALLMAIDNLSDYLREGWQTYYKNQTEQYLDQAMDAGMSEPLNALWAATETILQESPQPEEWFRYHVEHTLKELLPSKSSAATEKGAPQMPPMEMPPVPKFNAQNVNLAQMQGFNPLQAAQQMGIGMTAGMKKMECNISQIPGMDMVPPPIPSMEQVAPPPFPPKEGNSDM